uniref:Ribosome-recycling factor, mitochondrial n=1 Tax=Daphnia pulex TaxID=6669 RepID=A0A4Y7MUQ2_DAPPU|nr:EOG090X0DUK [Daphnia pulex]
MDFPGTLDVPRPRTRSVRKIVPPAQALISTRYPTAGIFGQKHRLWITIDRKTFHPSVVERCDQGKALRSVSTEAIKSISQPLKTAEEEETDTEDLTFEITSLNTRRKIKKEKKEKKEKKAQVMKARSKSSKVVKGSVIINEDEIAELVKVSSLKQDLQKGLDQLKSDYVKHLSLRSASGSIENLKIDYEGETYTLQEIAQIGKKGSQLLVVNLSGFPTLMRDVLKAINDSGMGLNPQQDGTKIFIPIPKVTREYRENLAKNAKTMFQKFKDHSRDIQNRYIRDVKKKEKEVSSDLSHSVQQQIQTMTEQYVVEGEKVMIAKQNELLGKE